MIEAERAFAAMAQAKGQWTAFRAFAAPDATMFVPQPVKAQEWLKGRADPPVAVRWQPTRAWTSCDGTLAVTTGNWQRDGRVGYFTTVWRRQPDGTWKWVIDHGDDLATPRAAARSPLVSRPDCHPGKVMHLSQLLVESPEQPMPSAGGGRADDGSLVAGWLASGGAHTLTVEQRRIGKPGRFPRARYMLPVINETVAAKP